MTDAKFKYGKLNSKPFISECVPLDAYDDPDWVPTLNLDYKEDIPEKTIMRERRPVRRLKRKKTTPEYVTQESESKDFVEIPEFITINPCEDDEYENFFKVKDEVDIVECKFVVKSSPPSNSDDEEGILEYVTINPEPSNVKNKRRKNIGQAKLKPATRFSHASNKPDRNGETTKEIALSIKRVSGSDVYECKVCLGLIKDNKYIKLFDKQNPEAAELLRNKMKYMIQDLKLDPSEDPVICQQCEMIIKISCDTSFDERSGESQDKSANTKTELSRNHEKSKPGSHNGSQNPVQVCNSAEKLQQNQVNETSGGIEAEQSNASLIEEIFGLDTPPVSPNGVHSDTEDMLVDNKEEETSCQEVAAASVANEDNPILSSPKPPMPALSELSSFANKFGLKIVPKMLPAAKPRRVQTEQAKLKENNYICDICGVRHETLIKMHYHQQHHKEVEEGPFTCEICGKISKTKQLLNSHLKRHTEHEEGKVFPCKLCGKEFGYLSGLKGHINKVHRPRAGHKCNICGKVLKYGYSYRNHMLIHKAPPNLPCHFCNKMFRYKWNLLTHIKIHMKQENLAAKLGKTASLQKPKPVQQIEKAVDIEEELEEEYNLDEPDVETLIDYDEGFEEQSVQMIENVVDDDDYESEEYTEIETIDGYEDILNDTVATVPNIEQPKAKFKCEICFVDFYAKEIFLEHLESSHNILVEDSSEVLAEDL